MPVFTTRPIIMGTRGVVTSGHYLATAAGFRIMEQGGNAIFVLFAKAELRTKRILMPRQRCVSALICWNLKAMVSAVRRQR